MPTVVQYITQMQNERRNQRLLMSNPMIAQYKNIENSRQQRASPAPNMNFPDPNLAPPGMPPPFYPQMPNNPMMRPPSSQPGANFNGQQQMTPQQMEAMSNDQMNDHMNGLWRGPPQSGMPQQPLAMGGPVSLKKKATRDNKIAIQKPAPKKEPNARTTPAPSASEGVPTPTPSTPITPMHAKSFNPNGQPQQAPLRAQHQPQQPPQQQQPIRNDTPFSNLAANDVDIGVKFGDIDAETALDNFDFDSFLHVENEERNERPPISSNQALPTSNQANEVAPRKKGTKGNKVQ
ncbi:hypothetical protein C7974DRAFT_380593 [Boeremia exigua]|uniref:uncharacterized protein n=1 Tax=Boeremia exigua TaxID=749465 RepID=UPI001E8DE658|nr:uncharacterized protein C7974DRAFT_380593 [Boeremia exigua]KAH6614246.1 hypothetical protein C7974DRAFT_380593 [Boeremia exigua]